MSGEAKIGAGALQAFARQGFKELAQVIPATPESVRVVEEPGAIANPTPQIVTRQMNSSPPAKGQDLDLDMGR